MPYKSFSPAVLPSADVNTYLMNQSVMTFANASARSTALTSPIEGMVTYLEDTNKTYQYDGANWLEIVKLDSAGRFVNTTQPSFLATRTSNITGYTNASQNQIVAYNSTWYNVGGHYNTSNGRFTAPVSGNYVFETGAYCSGTFYQIWWVINGNRERSFEVDSGSGILAGAGTLYLNANDWIGVAYWTNSASVTIYTSGFHTYFRGCLIG